MRNIWQKTLVTHMEVTMHSYPVLTIKCMESMQVVKVIRKDLQDHLARCPRRQFRCRKPWKPPCKDLKKHEEDDQLHLLIVEEGKPKQKQLAEKYNLIHMFIKYLEFTFTMKHFHQYKTENKSFYSDPFYTSRIGYKMCIRVEANGYSDNKSFYVSVYAHLMKGDNDDSLTWPFTGTVTIELLNQLTQNEKNHHKKTVTFPPDHSCSKRVVEGEIAQSGWGEPKYIDHKDLHHKPAYHCCYLTNPENKLIFRVLVRENKQRRVGKVGQAEC